MGSQMPQNCVLCSMTYNNNKTKETSRPFKLCQKIVKSCIEYMDKDALGDEFIKLDCRRAPFPLCSRCFVTTEKLSQLNDQLDNICAQIIDLVDSFKLEFLKSRELISNRNSTKSTNEGEKGNHNDENTQDTTQVEVKKEMVLEESDLDSENLENDNYTNEIMENVPDEDTTDIGQESIVKASSKRELSNVDSSSSSEDDGSSLPKKRKRKIVDNAEFPQYFSDFLKKSLRTDQFPSDANYVRLMNIVNTPKGEAVKGVSSDKKARVQKMFKTGIIDGTEFLLCRSTGRKVLKHSQFCGAMQMYHDEEGHPGRDGTHRKLHTVYKNVPLALVSSYIKNCVACTDRRRKPIQ